MRHDDRPAPRVPADHGLACLGLLLQLAGGLLAAYGTLAAFAALLSAHRFDDDRLWVFLVLATGVGRSLVHRAAGAQLVYGDRAVGVPGPVEQTPSDEKRLAGIHRYLGVSVLHSAVVAAIAAGHFHAPGCSVVGIVGALLVWPAVLFIVVAHPRIRPLGRRLPVPADKGFEAAAIVMTVLACGGLALPLAILGAMWRFPAEELQQGPDLMAMVMLVVLVVRAGLHLQAGIAGLRETSIEGAVGLATRYANFAVISTFCAGAAAFLVVAAAHFDLVGLAIAVGLVWMLLTWPLIVRRFFSDRQFDDLLAGDDAVAHHRAPDAGLSGLGWLLVANAAVSLTWLLLRLATADHPGLPGALAIPGGPDGALPWQLVAIALGGWAGLELVGMTSRARAVTLAWAIASIGVAIYLIGPDLASGALVDRLPDVTGLAGIGWLAAQIVLPAAGLLLVTRRVAPAARARYRARPLRS